MWRPHVQDAPFVRSRRRARDGSSTWPLGGARGMGATVHTSASLIGHRLLAEFNVPSVAGNDRVAADRVASAVRALPLGAARLENLRTAVAEATLNAIEHGNRFAPDKPVGVRVVASDDELCVTVSDSGAGRAEQPVAPDLSAKLKGE